MTAADQLWQLPMWHGGAKGRKVGDLLLPPDQTGVTPLATWGEDAGLDVTHVRTDRVFLTVSSDTAIMYAAMHPGPAVVYRVQPLGEIEPDPDCHIPGLSWQAERARVVSIHPLPRKVRDRVREAMSHG